MAWPEGGRIVSIKESPVSVVDSTQMESGMEKRRLRYSRQLTTYNIVMTYSYDEYTTWKAWYVGTEAKRGAGTFDWVHPGSNLAMTARFVQGGVPEWNYQIRVGQEVRYRLTISLGVYE